MILEVLSIRVQFLGGLCRAYTLQLMLLTLLSRSVSHQALQSYREPYALVASVDFFEASLHILIYIYAGSCGSYQDSPAPQAGGCCEPAGVGIIPTSLDSIPCWFSGRFKPYIAFLYMYGEPQCPLMYMIYLCISLSPIKHPKKWAIAKLRFNKSFHDVPPLSKSHKFTYPNECGELFTCFFCLTTIHIYRISNPYQ